MTGVAVRTVVAETEEEEYRRERRRPAAWSGRRESIVTDSVLS